MTIDRHEVPLRAPSGSSARRPRVLGAAAVVAVLLVGGAWSYFAGPFDGEWRLEREVRQDLDAWEAAGADDEVMTGANAARAATSEGAAAGPAEDRLAVTFLGGACDTYAGQAVESENAVAVLVLTRTDGGDCPSIGLFAALEVQLDDPVGDRVLFDAQSGRRLERLDRLPRELPVVGPGEHIPWR